MGFLFVLFLLEFTTSGQESSDVDIYWILIFRLEIRSLSQNMSSVGGSDLGMSEGLWGTTLATSPFK